MFHSVKETGCIAKISPNITTASSSLCMSKKEDMFTGLVTGGIEIGDKIPAGILSLPFFKRRNMKDLYLMVCFCNVLE